MLPPHGTAAPVTASHGITNLDEVEVGKPVVLRLWDNGGGACYFEMFTQTAPQETAPAAEPVATDATRQVVLGVWGRCEALEEEAYAKLEKRDGMDEHEVGFWRGQKLTAKSIRRSTAMPAAPPPSAAPTDMHPLGDSVWIASHAGEYGCYYPEGVEAEGEHGGTAVEFRRVAAPTDTALVEALRPFAEAADIKLCGEWRDDERFGGTDAAYKLTFGHLRAARAALASRAAAPREGDV